MASPVVTDISTYLGDGYMSGDYMSGGELYAYGSQVQMVVNTDKKIGQQTLMTVNSNKKSGQQTLMTVAASKKIGQQAFMTVNTQRVVGQQARMTIPSSSARGMQAHMEVAASLTKGQQIRGLLSISPHYGQQALLSLFTNKVIGQQTQMNIASSKVVGQQVKAIVNRQTTYGMQVDAFVNKLKATGMEAYHDTLRHWLHEVYLEGDYLTEAYLVEMMCAFLGQQTRMTVAKQSTYGMQTLMTVTASKNIGQQVKMIVYTDRHYGMQVALIKALRLGQQAQMIIYNNTQFRILREFASRGTNGINWSSTSTAAGDFGPNNLNTDVEEQVFRSGVSSIELICDTQITQGVTIDTIGIRNHNLTKNALIQVQGSNSPTFASINVTFDMSVELLHAYYIAAVAPTGVANQNRYWKFVISDPTNPSAYVQIGCILFGTANIISKVDEFDNPIRYGYRHFRDALQTEGFTATMNDRALKKYLRLSFSELSRKNRNNEILVDYMMAARTSLKCLIIPTPLYASRHAVFAKLKEMPEIIERDVSDMDANNPEAQYLGIDFDWDESL